MLETLDERRRKLLDDAEKLAGIGSFEWDIPANKVTWSDGLYAIYGLDRDEFASSFEGFLAQVHPDDRNKVKTTIETAYRECTPFSIEERIVRSDGSVRVLRSKGEVVADASGSAVRIIGVCQDITEAKHSEELVAEWNQTLERRVHERTLQLEAMQQQMVTQARMATVGNLVAGITHEVNSPIGAFKAAADTIERCVERLGGVLDRDASLEKYVSTLRQSAYAATEAASRLEDIVGRLKALSSLDESPLTEVNLNDALDGILTLIRHSTSEDVRVTKDYGNVPVLRCDAGQVSHVLMNLLLNAHQAIDGEGEISISTWAENGDVFVRIRDSGRGIPPERLERLFELGFTARRSKIRLGMGLFTAYNVVHKHGGDIEVSSEIGQGASFTVRLPIDRASRAR